MAALLLVPGCLVASEVLCELTRGGIDDAGGMVERGDLLGLSADDVVKRLGDPKTDDRFYPADWYYHAGPDAACIDNRWLLLRFGDDGLVADARIMTD